MKIGKPTEGKDKTSSIATTLLAGSLIASAVGGAVAHGNDNYSPGFDNTDILVQQAYGSITNGVPAYVAFQSALAAQAAFDGTAGLYEGGTVAERLRAAVCNPNSKGLSLARVAASDKIDPDTRYVANLAFQYQTAKKLGETGKMIEIALSEETPDELRDGYKMASDVRKNLAEIGNEKQIYRAIELCGENCIPTLLYDNPNVQGQLFLDLTKQRDEEYRRNYFDTGLESGRINPNINAEGALGQASRAYLIDQEIQKINESNPLDSDTYRKLQSLAEGLHNEEETYWKTRIQDIKCWNWEWGPSLTRSNTDRSAGLSGKQYLREQGYRDGYMNPRGKPSNDNRYHKEGFKSGRNARIRGY